MANLDIRHMDCMDLMAQYPDKYFELAIVDPPYGIGIAESMAKKNGKNRYKKREPKDWDSSIPNQSYFEQLLRVSKNQIIWGGNYFSLPPTRCVIVWDKVQRINQADCEIAWTSFKSSARIFDYARGNESGFAPKSIETDKSFANIHPTQKPVALYKWLLTNYAKPGDKILDTHLGSGSIALACYDYGFDLTACELDKDYYEAAMKRIANHTAQTRLFTP